MIVKNEIILIKQFAKANIKPKFLGALLTLNEHLGGMRGGRPISSTASFGGSDHSARIRSGASRGGRGGFIGH